MFSEPDDPKTVARMRAAHQRACASLEVQPDGHQPTVRHEVWGWRGRTLSRPVTGARGLGWLRVVCAPTDKAGGKLWTGPQDAQQAMPAAVPRPRLHTVSDWTDGTLAYRAELYERVTAQPISPNPALTTPLDLPSAWWSQLRTALDHIATVPTTRTAVRQDYLGRSMPEYLGTSLDTTVPAWATAHGDLHWANLTTPPLTILDWEGWGTAPAGYDAALLHAYSLNTPDTASRVRAELSHLLDTPTGRFAELAVITELLQTTTRGDNLDLESALHQRATQLLQQ